MVPFLIHYVLKFSKKFFQVFLKGSMEYFESHSDCPIQLSLLKKSKTLNIKYSKTSVGTKPGRVTGTRKEGLFSPPRPLHRQEKILSIGTRDSCTKILSCKTSKCCIRHCCARLRRGKV